MTSLIVYSQNDIDFYAYIKQDFTTSTGKSFHSGSLLPLDVKFKIQEYDETKASNKNQNKTNGIITGAVFPVYSFIDDKTPSDTISPKRVSLNLVRFKAGDDIRYNVSGVKGNVQYLINGEEIDSIQCFLIVPKTLVQNVSEAWQKIIILESVINADATLLCLRINIDEIFDSTRYALVYGEEKTQCRSINDSIYLLKSNNVGPSSISFAFSDLKNLVFIPDFLVQIEDFHRVEMSGGKEEEGWYKRNDFWVNPLGMLLLCAIVAFLIHRYNKKKIDIEKNLEKETREKFVKIIKNIPENHLEKWNEASMEKRAEILRSSTDKKFNHPDDYMNFWGEVDYEKDTKIGASDDELALVLAAFSSGNKGITDNDEHKEDYQKNKGYKRIVNPKSTNETSLSSREIEELNSLLEKKSSEILTIVNKVNEPISKISEIERSVSNIKAQVSNSNKIDQIHQNLLKLEETVNTIKSLVTNTGEKEKLEDLSNKLTEKATIETKLTENLKTAKATIIEREKTIQSLNDSIKSLEKQLVIPDSVEVKGLGNFIVFAQHLLNTISKAENNSVRDWTAISDTIVKERAGYFITTELATRPTKEIERWISIFATLKTKSVITDLELVKEIKIVDEKERVTYINKRFAESVVVPLVSCALVLLEQFRTGKEWGFVGAASEAYASSIKEIIVLCKNADIDVNYCKLYEKLSNYDNVEIEVTVPAPVCDWIDTNRKDIVLYVKKYSVSSKLLNHVEKTSCVVAI